MRNFVRRFAIGSLAVCGLPLLPICCAAFAQEAQQVDGIAAIVNGDVITYSQVRQLSAPRERLLRSQFTGQDLDNKLREVRQLALKDLIVIGDVITYSQVRQLSAPRERLLRSQFTGQDLDNKLREVRQLALKDLI